MLEEGFGWRRKAALSAHTRPLAIEANAGPPRRPRSGGAAPSASCLRGGVLPGMDGCAEEPRVAAVVD
jgi:hypothetical protein